MAIITFIPIPAFADGDPDAGEQVFRRCISCHAIGPEAVNKVGPPLNEIFGRVAGSMEGFRFSRAMVAAGQEGLVWDDATMDAFITRPSRFVSGTRMSFSGLRSPEDRTNLIAFLHTLTPETAMGTAHILPEDPELPDEIMSLVGDVAYGQYLASSCVTCHQPDGTESNIPSIIGWPAPAMVTVLHAYKNKNRDNNVMQQQTGILSNEEIAALAAYFETLE
ncbi:MAG: c-type cytochrome [Rhodobacteraceae bacterium]|nr:c-type cytochrome [Paracoccaceae bacterium]